MSARSRAAGTTEEISQRYLPEPTGRKTEDEFFDDLQQRSRATDPGDKVGVIIEVRVVLDFVEDASGSAETLERILDEGRSYGAAEIVGRVDIRP